MTVKDLLNEFKKFSVDGMHARNVLSVIKNLSKDKKTLTKDDIKNEIRNYNHDTINKALEMLEQEKCIEIKNNKIYFKKDC